MRDRGHLAEGAPRDRAVALWLIACCAMIAIMVVLGGVTRLTQSGLSITEWRPVTGILPPLGEAEWQAEFAKYRAIPQFQALHSWMGLADFKIIFFWEWLHRLWGRLIGLAFALPLAGFLLRRRIGPALRRRLFGLFVLGALQGVLGWVMVESGLADRIAVSQYRLVAHLGLAILIYAAMLWTALGLLRPAPDPGGAAAGLRRGAAALAALVFVTMLAGGFVAGLNAGLTYNTFPLMDGRFVPADYGALAPWWRNLFENVAAAQFDHRLLAESSFAGALLLWAAGRRRRAVGPPRRALDLMIGAALLQVALGIATLLLAVPVWLGALHQAGALLFFTAALILCHRLRAAPIAAATPRPAGRLDESRAALL